MVHPIEVESGAAGDGGVLFLASKDTVDQTYLQDGLPASVAEIDMPIPQRRFGRVTLFDDIGHKALAGGEVLFRLGSVGQAVRSIQHL